MDEMEMNLSKFIEEHNIEAEHLVFETSCHSVEEAAQAAGVTAQDFIKSICMLDKENNLIVAIVKGEDRASESNVRKELEIKRPRTASPDEIQHYTGFECGGVPPFGYDATYLIDDKVMENDLVFGGGGSEKSLVKITPEEMQKANGGTVASIRK